MMFLMLCIAIAACASGNKLTLAPTDPIIAYSETQAKNVNFDAQLRSSANGSELSIEESPLLSRSNHLKNYRPNRAYAVGYPYECGGSWNTWNYNSSKQAATAALNGCLEYVKNREKHVGKKCGARLIVINKKLLVNPEELPKKNYVPFIMETKSEDEIATLYGMFSSRGLGKDLPLELYNEKGKKLCEGNYTLSKTQAFLGAGTFEMKCFNEQIEAQGELSMKKIRIGSSSSSFTIGIGKGKASDGSDFKFLTNITIDDYEKYKYLLR